MDYFLEHDVYSQDPFTSQVEPSIPFGLGLIVHNGGLGVANDFTITSAQPTIIANSNGLVIAFEIIGSQAGTNQLPSPSLTMDLGAIPAGGDATGVWLMTSTLEGAFIGYSAIFQHIDALGATNTSLINSVAIHEMNHIVRLTVPEDDGIPDFLVNDTTNVDALPDNVYSSTGPVFPVTSLTNVIVIRDAFSNAIQRHHQRLGPAGMGLFAVPGSEQRDDDHRQRAPLRRRQPAGGAECLADA